MNILDELFYGTMKIIQIWKLSNLKNNIKKKKHCIECKYERKYDKIYEKKYKIKRRACYCLLEQKLSQIRTLETEIAVLKSATQPPADKSVFLNEISIFCRDILFD